MKVYVIPNFAVSSKIFVVFWLFCPVVDKLMVMMMQSTHCETGLVVLLAKLTKYDDCDDDDGGDSDDDGNNDDLDLVPGGRGCSPCQAPTGSCSSSSATTPAIISISISCHQSCCHIIRSVGAWKAVNATTPARAGLWYFWFLFARE